MAQYRVYNKAALARLNPVYLSDYAHRIETSDVQFANKCIKAMFNSLNSKTPKVGDVIEYTMQDGTYYHAAQIEGIVDGTTAVVCLVPFIPYVHFDSDGKLSFECGSGGPWVDVPLEKLKYIGTRDKTCRFWGSSGVCAYGAIDFDGYATCWEFKEDGLLYGDFSTKFYDRIIFKRYDGDRRWYAYGPDPENLPTKSEDVPAWLAEHKGRQFGDFQKDDMVVVYAYKERNHLIDLKKWQSMKLPQSTRKINNSLVYVKFAVDDEKKIIDVFRYANSMGTKPWN